MTAYVVDGLTLAKNAGYEVNEERLGSGRQKLKEMVEAGKTEAAKAPLQKALELRPAQKEFLELRDKLAAPTKPPSAAALPPPEPPVK